MWIPRNVARGLHRIHQPHALGKNPFLEQIQHQRGGADLQRGRVFAHVRIADEQMQAAILAVIGQRLVAGIDDRAVELHPLINVVHDVVGALRNLEVHGLIVAAVVELEGERIGLADAARSRENLPRRQKRQQCGQHLRGELRAAFHQVVLVASKRCTRVMVDVVLHERHPVGDGHALQRVLQDAIARMIERNHVAQADAFGRRVLDVPHVEIQPAAVEQEPAVAGRFLVIAIVQVDRPESRDFEQMVLDADGERVGTALAVIAAHQTAILGFQPDDPVHKSFRAARISFSSNKRNFPVAGRLRSRTAAST